MGTHRIDEAILEFIYGAATQKTSILGDRRENLKSYLNIVQAVRSSICALAGSWLDDWGSIPDKDINFSLRYSIWAGSGVYLMGAGQIVTLVTHLLFLSKLPSTDLCDVALRTEQTRRLYLSSVWAAFGSVKSLMCACIYTRWIERQVWAISLFRFLYEVTFH